MTTFYVGVDQDTIMQAEAIFISATACHIVGTKQLVRDETVMNVSRRDNKMRL